MADKILYPHNVEQYKKLNEAFEYKNKACAIQPTGTGKMYLAIKWLDEHPNEPFVYIAPTNVILNSFIEVLSGALVPVVMLPMFIQEATYDLPFRLISDLTFRLYTNNMGISEGLLSLGFQVIWIIVLILVGNFIVKKSLKKVFVQGG